MANAWTTAETNAAAYLATALSDTIDTEGFVGEFPASFADLTLDYMWYFAITGGGTPDDTGAGVPACGLNADAIFEGVFESRETAQSYGCTIKNLFPVAAGAVSGVYDWRLSAEPLIERAIIRRNPDQAAAGELRVWRLTIPTVCTIQGL